MIGQDFTTYGWAKLPANLGKELEGSGGKENNLWLKAISGLYRRAIVSKFVPAVCIWVRSHLY